MGQMLPSSIFKIYSYQSAVHSMCSMNREAYIYLLLNNFRTFLFSLALHCAIKFYKQLRKQSITRLSTVCLGL